jgi:hypothetical protein
LSAFGATKPTIAEQLMFVRQMERKLIISILASMQLYFLYSLLLPTGSTNQIDRIFRQCLWRDKDGGPKHFLDACEMICKPKLKGGLGLVNF